MLDCRCRAEQGRSAYDCVKNLVRLRRLWFLMSLGGSAAGGLYCVCPSTAAEA